MTASQGVARIGRAGVPEFQSSRAKVQGLYSQLQSYPQDRIGAISPSHWLIYSFSQLTCQDLLQIYNLRRGACPFVFLTALPGLFPRDEVSAKTFTLPLYVFYPYMHEKE